MTNHRSRRFYTEFHDSVRQREYAGEAAASELSPQYFLGYKGRLRFDSLLSERIIVTDAQVLDGSFFLAHTPEQLESLFGRTIGDRVPLEIRSRYLNLGDALVGLMRRPQRTELYPFFFSSIPRHEMRAHVSRELPRRDLERVRAWRDVPALLAELGVPREHVEDLSRAWEAWSQEAAVPIAQSEVVPYQHAALAAEGVDVVRDSLGTDDGCRLLDWFMSTPRSTIFCEVPDLRRTLAEDSLADLEAIWSWYNRAYNRASATVHDAAFESLDSASKPVSDVRRAYDVIVHGEPILARDLHLEVPSTFIDTLAEMEDELFASLLRRSAANLEQWWYEGDLDALKRALEPFYKYVRSSAMLPGWAATPLRWVLRQHDLVAPVVGAGVAAKLFPDAGPMAAAGGALAAGIIERYAGLLAHATVLLLSADGGARRCSERAIVETAQRRLGA